MNKRSQQTFLQGRYENGEEANDRYTTPLTNHEGKVNQKYNEIPLSTCWDSYN